MVAGTPAATRAATVVNSTHRLRNKVKVTATDRQEATVARRVAHRLRDGIKLEFASTLYADVCWANVDLY